MFLRARSPDEAKIKLPLKASTSLTEALEKLDLSKKAESEKQGQRPRHRF